MKAKDHFLDAQNTLAAFLADEGNFERIEEAINIIVNAFQNGGKIIACGNGGSHCDANTLQKNLQEGIETIEKPYPH